MECMQRQRLPCRGTIGSTWCGPRHLHLHPVRPRANSQAEAALDGRPQPEQVFLQVDDTAVAKQVAARCGAFGHLGAHGRLRLRDRGTAAGAGDYEGERSRRSFLGRVGRRLEVFVKCGHKSEHSADDTQNLRRSKAKRREAYEWR
jgi:hypothetical protein